MHFYKCTHKLHMQPNAVDTLLGWTYNLRLRTEPLSGTTLLRLAGLYPGRGDSARNILHPGICMKVLCGVGGK